jgi:hypothetical protein
MLIPPRTKDDGAARTVNKERRENGETKEQRTAVYENSRSRVVEATGLRRACRIVFYISINNQRSATSAPLIIY